MLAGIAVALAATFGPAPSSSVGGGVLLVDIDDVGHGLLAETPTPTLDWIAAHGRTFTRFLASPSCSPTRAMMMTGAYPSHPDLLLGQIVGSSQTYQLRTAPLELLPRVVQDAGWTTAKIGKWHLAPRIQTQHPNACGWQHYAGALTNVQGFGESYTSYTKVVNGVGTLTTGRYITTDETDDAIACVQAGIDLISVSYHAPHQPWHVPPAHLHSIADTTGDRDKVRAMLQACDRELGRLVRVALSSGYTILVFADNGTAAGIGGQKGTVLDGGVIVPFFAVGPGIAPGVEDGLVSVVDLYDTTLDLFGIDASSATRGPHSSSLVPALQGRPLERRFGYAERFQGLGQDPRTSTGWWDRAVRGTRFKLRSHRTATSLEITLHDMIADPDESVDLLQAPLSPEADDAYRLFLDVLARL
ncbi:MAG: sulfatase-like hydrolase/transferase [Planctomycetota bacterium]